MKIERIKVGHTYLAVYRGHEILVRIDAIVDFHLWCTNIETNKGIALQPEAVRAGPLTLKPKQHEH